jgi:hypothetical protein
MTGHYQFFVDRWTHPKYRPQPCTSVELDSVEKQLATYLPSSLREFLESFGPVNTNIDLLDHIVNRELDLHDVSEFHDAEAIVQETMAWRDLGLDSDAVAFASDCQGNLFYFKSGSARSPDSEVWFFDHDLRTNEPLGVNFKEWVSAFTNLRT